MSLFFQNFKHYIVSSQKSGGIAMFSCHLGQREKSQNGCQISLFGRNNNKIPRTFPEFYLLAVLRNRNLSMSFDRTNRIPENSPRIAEIIFYILTHLKIGVRLKDELVIDKLYNFLSAGYHAPQNQQESNNAR
ncbi:MAG: hypothetical protein HQM10_08345 [Candidatus Riflebacteria bacterium]|nr:hypothetical protein [Candidatus Riflebacteria bacterium]